MPDDGNRHQIILVPADRYWEWVTALRSYAVHYRAAVTAHPENAVRYHRPHQVITVVDAPHAYESYGSVVDWLRAQAPEVQLDVLVARSPQQLQNALAERIRQGQRLGDEASPVGHVAEPPLRLQWPTDYPVITQPFGANPEVYRRWGLPGHDGIDFRAATNSNVYACADGEVYMVHDGTAGHAYGIHVRIRHHDGYRTVYAHLNQPLVHTGQVVKAGEIIGLAGNTGNAAHSHLHLALKKEGATRAGLTDYPADLIDPTPFLVERPVGRPAFQRPGWWPYETCLFGLQARIGGPMQEPDWAVVRTAGVEALKFQSAADRADVRRAREVNPEMLVLAQLSVDFAGRPVSPREFAARVRGGMASFYDEGVRLFEVHDEPNLTPQGFGTSWQSGEEFGAWFGEVVRRLRGEFPGARFGWPGLSPGPSTSGIRRDHRAFLDGARSAIAQADWIGCHCYWQTEDEMLSEDGGLAYRLYRDEWPDKLLLITAFSNPAPDVSAGDKGGQYARFLSQASSEPGVGAAFGFVVSSVEGYAYEQWRAADGTPSAIVDALAAPAR